jgi:hypothetical protein
MDPDPGRQNGRQKRKRMGLQLPEQQKIFRHFPGNEFCEFKSAPETDVEKHIPYRTNSCSGSTGLNKVGFSKHLVAHEV